VVTGFLGRHPDASVDLRTGHVMIDLVQVGFDLAITTLPPPDSSLISRRLAAGRFILCCAPVYLEKHPTPRCPSDPAAHNCPRYAHIPFGDQWPFLDAGGNPVVARVSGNLMTTSPETLRAAAFAGIGVVLMPSSCGNLTRKVQIGRQRSSFICRLTADKALVCSFGDKSPRHQRYSFQGSRGRKQDSPVAQLLDHGGNDDIAAIRARGRLDRDTGNAAIITALKRANAKTRSGFRQGGPCGFHRAAHSRRKPRGDANLRGNEDEHVGRRVFLRSENTAGEPQIGEMNGKPQTVRIAPPPQDQCQVLG
jgi:hypothetical protein